MTLFPKLKFKKNRPFTLYIYDIVCYVVFYAQKLSKMIVKDVVRRTHGKAGLRLEAAGAVTTITYNKKNDGRIELDKLGWKNFIEGKHFQINQPVLIVLRNTNHRSLGGHD